MNIPAQYDLGVAHFIWGVAVFSPLFLLVGVTDGLVILSGRFLRPRFVFNATIRRITNLIYGFLLLAIVVFSYVWGLAFGWGGLNGHILGIVFGKAITEKIKRTYLNVSLSNGLDLKKEASDSESSGNNREAKHLLEQSKEHLELWSKTIYYEPIISFDQTTCGMLFYYIIFMFPLSALLNQVWPGVR